MKKLNSKFRNSNFRNFLARRWRGVKSAIRKALMLGEEFRVVYFPRSPRDQIKLLNLDLHIGVIADLETELSKANVSLTRWSISGHNGLIRKFLKISDPVRFVNASSWRQIGNKQLVEKFQRRYRRFISKFDGFVITYSPTLAPLFEKAEKPTLIVAATRYETPFTGDERSWGKFNSWLAGSVRAEKVMVAANNRADADYIEYFTNVKPAVVPSLCEKPGGMWRGGNGKRVIVGRVPGLDDEVAARTGGIFQPISSLGSPYAWEDVLQCEEVLVLPQNISTMTLFELATAGVPVSVPDRTWVKELRNQYPQVLVELSFAQLEALPTIHMEKDNPNNWESEEFLDWWLDRADFYDSALMPNIRTVSSFTELMQDRTDLGDYDAYISRVVSRNEVISRMRNDLISEFLAMVDN